MIRPNVQLSLANARSYFREHLCVGDYYSEQGHVAGEWFGTGADELKLAGWVRALPFLAMCDGMHPRSGGRLTQRRNSVRSVAGRLHANRRVFFDFVFSPPKSVSIVALMEDPRIVALHADSVRVAMRELERFAETRVRTADRNTTRCTGNLVVAMFQHDTSRELDPLLHTHCVTFNATRDAVEGRWKALDVSEMYRAQKYAEACYQHELVKGLMRLGYTLVRSPHNFEIKGIDRSMLDLFSKRHRQIDEEAAEAMRSRAKGVNEDELRERIARTSRKRKMKDATADQLRGHWRAQLTSGQRSALSDVRPSGPGSVTHVKPEILLTLAEADVFERNAVARDYQVLATALLRGRSTDFALDELKQAMERRPYVRHGDGREIALRDQFDVEVELLTIARRGIETKPPLDTASALPASLDGEQRAAVTDILNSMDKMIVFRGGAGTGKSFALKHAIEAMRLRHTVIVAAPQNQQVQGLERDGLKSQTLASLLATGALPADAVVVLDEAGQVGARQMLKLMKQVEACGGRLLLSGDTRQHGAVEASDALAHLEQGAGIWPIELKTIRRQDPSRAAIEDERKAIRIYRSAVEAAAEQRTYDSFAIMCRQGWVLEVSRDEKLDRVAEEYMLRGPRKSRLWWWRRRETKLAGSMRLFVSACSQPAS